MERDSCLVDLGDLEELAIMTMIPFGMAIEVDGKTAFNPEFFEYKKELDRIAFSSERDYNGFRELLWSYKDLFKDSWEDIEGMSNEVVDYVLDRVKEERIGHFMENPES